jgi:N-acetylglucosaminyldiphosphoundecaprenol N-acetyl-beta-D-mannosaminyltransferase
MAIILGINTGEISWSELKGRLASFYNDRLPHQLVTPNPEIILKAQKDEELFYILNRADLSLADGFGLKIAAKISGQKLYRCTGADLLPYLLQEAEGKRRVSIINRHDGLSSSQDLEKYLKTNYPRLEYQILDSPKKISPSEEDIMSVQAFNPNLAICLFGAPEQEKYLFQLQEKLVQISLSVGLGGAFDFLTGKLKRAPQLWRNLGLEWFWRFIQQPWRWQRIWRATMVFSRKVLYWRFIMPHLYRPNVAVLMYKSGKDGREIFIVERQDRESHWQLPQGGLDGEDIAVAGAKELREESGAKNFKIIKVYKNLYRYQFNKETGKDILQRHFGYRGQKQSLLIVEFQGKDTELKINYWDHRAWRWIKEEYLLTHIHPCRQAAAKIYLEKLKEAV